MATIRDLEIDQGSDKTLVFTVYNNEATLPNLVNISGYTARFWIAKAQGIPAILKIDSTNGVTIQGSAGTITVMIQHALTSALKFPDRIFKGCYQVELVAPDTRVYRVCEGAITISKEIIKP